MNLHTFRENFCNCTDYTYFGLIFMFQAGVMIKTVACDLMKASSKCWLYALAVSLLSFQKSLKSLKLGGVIRGWF